MESGIVKKQIYYLILKFKPNKNNGKWINILYQEFVKKNRNKCKIIYRNKIYKLKTYFEEINVNYNYKDLIKFKLLFINDIIDMSNMFYGCNALVSLSTNSETNIDILKLKTYIKNISYMLKEGSSSKSSLDTSKWYTSNLNNINYIFWGCNALTSLLNISKWKYFNANKEYSKFSRCKPLVLPQDFYRLNKYKNYIIFELTYKHDRYTKILDQRFINNNKDKVKIIYNNSEYELKELEEYLKLLYKDNKDTFEIILCLDKNIKNISYIFYECKSLVSIEYYQIKNHFYGINNKLNSLHYESKSKLSNMNNMSNLRKSSDFYECFKESKSDISKKSEQSDTNLLLANENFKPSFLIIFFGNYKYEMYVLWM